MQIEKYADKRKVTFKDYDGRRCSSGQTEDLSNLPKNCILPLTSFP